MSADYGTLQLLISSTDPGATTAGGLAQYTTFLSGNYRLRLLNIQLNSTAVAPAVRPVQIVLNGIENFYGVQHATILYPTRAEDLIGFGLEIEYAVKLQNTIGVQVREIDGSPMVDFAYCVLSFRYERV